MAQPAVVKDQGRTIDGHRVLVRPGMDYEDLPGSTTIYILVCPYRDIPGLPLVFTPRDLHWMLLWGPVREEGSYYRIIQATREWDPRASSTIASTAVYLDFLTNPGPRTLSLTKNTEENGTFIPLSSLDRQGRQALEHIAMIHPIRVPDGSWNCQDFIKEILAEAVRQGLFDPEVVDKALQKADQGLSRSDRKTG
ncbi:hypothetical protein NEOLEDRAFT_1148865 [Neolentinus lepideus HHB14362 ss-1]|uniref:Uncharacterized protein n=1 Tax=Neolentinus lepideus HHB14362 ss-1 TaxID=1314782 RepID=A0A165RU57_9AGAM|nr:hypothetical protein NEOLEDRAFT_1148865 [Neolentinus lepideus HHB14362 ss-1]